MKPLKMTSRFAALAKSLNVLGEISNEFTEVELIDAALSPNDPSTEVVPGRGEALFCYFFLL